MDIQVQELINKIKKDGIMSASEEAAKIKHEAETEAKQIIEAAKKQAEEIVAKGTQDAERAEKSSIAALEQAARNLFLVFRSEVQALLDRVVAEQMEESYNEDVLKAVLPDLLKAWATKGSDSLTVLLPEASLDRLQAYIKGKLVSEMKKGLELKPDRNLSSGFRISERDGSAYYDFSADSVAELVSMYLGPQLAEIIRASAKNI